LLRDFPDAIYAKFVREQESSDSASPIKEKAEE
jgi:hypothetical protein